MCSDDTEQSPDCGWCENKIQRLGGDVETDLCAKCLGKAKCGWAPDNRSLDTGNKSSEEGVHDV